MERTAALGTLGFIIGAVIVVLLNGPLHLLPDSLSRAVATLSRGPETNESESTDEAPEVGPEKSRWQREWEGLTRGLVNLARINARMRKAQLEEAERGSTAVATSHSSDTYALDRLQQELDRLKRDVSRLAETRLRKQAPTPVPVAPSPPTPVRVAPSPPTPVRVAPSPPTPVPMAPPLTLPARVTRPATKTGSSLSVRVADVHVGAEVVAHGIVPETTLNEHAKNGKYLVYFELALTNTATADTRQVSFRDFQLQDRQGLLYSPLEPAGVSWAKLPPKRTRRVGVVFAVYDDSAPERLLYKTASGAYVPLALGGPMVTPESK